MTSIIRLATVDDAEQVAAVYAPFVQHTPVSFELEPPTAVQMRDRMSAILERLPWLVCEKQGVVCGYVYASPHSDRHAYQWSVNVAVYIHSEYHRQGIGRALYTSLLDILRLQGFYNTYAGITLPNAGSVGLHESMGFVPVGVYREVGFKQGRWHDVGWWQRPLRERSAPTASPLALQEVCDTEAWQTCLASGLTLLHK